MKMPEKTKAGWAGCAGGLVIAILLLMPLGFTARAADRYWTNTSGGDFTNTDNWLGGAVPGASDKAHFSNSAAAFPVTFSVNVTNDYVYFDAAQTVNFSASPWTWTVLSDFGFKTNNSIVNWDGGALCPTAIYFKATGSRLVLSNGTVATYRTLVGSDVSSQSNTLLITGSGSVYSNLGAVWTDFSIGRTGACNTLVVTNGGRLGIARLVIGLESTASNNQVFVAGAGSVCAVGSYTYIGRPGNNNNSLTISDSGVLTNAGGWAYLYGTGSQFIVSSGGQGYGLHLQFGPGVYNSTALITGPGSKWQSKNNVYLADQGAFNTLIVSNGGLARVGETLYGGYGASSLSNQIIVTGAGSLLTATNDSGGNKESILIGYAGTGNVLRIEDGGMVKGYSTISVGGHQLTGSGLAASTGDYARILVTGGGVLTNTGGGIVGDCGVGNSLVVSNGGKVYMSDLSLGGSSSALTNAINSSLLLTDPWSLVQAAYRICLGTRTSYNTAIVSNGAQLVAGSQEGSVGVYATSVGNQVTVTGIGSVWRMNNVSLYVGNAGISNLLTISSGGLVSNTIGYVGGGSGEILVSSATGDWNRVVVTGGGVWSNSSSLYIGYAGQNNSLTVSNGGWVYAPTMVIGQTAASSNNTVLVTGSGSLLTNSSSLSVGYASGTQGGGNQLILGGGGRVSTPSLTLRNNVLTNTLKFVAIPGNTNMGVVNVVGAMTIANASTAKLVVDMSQYTAWRDGVTSVVLVTYGTLTTPFSPGNIAVTPPPMSSPIMRITATVDQTTGNRIQVNLRVPKGTVFSFR